MKLNKPTAAFLIPDNKPVDEALNRTTHMAIGAHQDDLEINSSMPNSKAVMRSLSSGWSQLIATNVGVNPAEKTL